MNLGPHDQHWLFDAGQRTVKAYGPDGTLLFETEARNRTTNNEPNYGHYSPLPSGEYVFGRPTPKNTVPFGPYFVPILDAPGHDELASRGRSGLGWHGGGSGLPDPFALEQGWVVTHGCERSQNVDLRKGVVLINQCQAQAGTCWVTNLALLPGASQEAGPDDYADVDPVLLWPDE